MLELTVHGRTFRAPDEPIFRNHFGDEMDLVEEYWLPGEGDVVFDVGAGAGRYTLPALMAGAWVYAIEPDAHDLEALERCARLNQVTGQLVRVCQAVFDGTAPLDEMLMIERSRNAGLSPRGADFTTLDRLVVRSGVERLDWIKVDVEGQELGVLRGALGSIARFNPVLFIEDHSKVYPELGPGHHEQLVGLLEGANYRVQVIEYEGPVARDYLLCRR